jgi:hypothetical protein
MFGEEMPAAQLAPLAQSPVGLLECADVTSEPSAFWPVPSVDKQV